MQPSTTDNLTASAEFPRRPKESSTSESKVTPTDLGQYEQLAEKIDRLQREDQKLKKLKRSRTRCHSCRKKVGLLGFDCRCGGMYCSAHRHAETHECDFDHRAHHQKILQQNVVGVRGAKLDRV